MRKQERMEGKETLSKLLISLSNFLAFKFKQIMAGFVKKKDKSRAMRAFQALKAH